MFSFPKKKKTNSIQKFLKYACEQIPDNKSITIIVLTIRHTKQERKKKKETSFQKKILQTHPVNYKRTLDTSYIRNKSSLPINHPFLSKGVNPKTRHLRSRKKRNKKQKKKKNTKYTLK